MSLLALAAIWAALGRVDIVSVAPGKIVPAGRVKVVQPLERGRVEKIHVADGEAVTQGQVLIELDATIATADQERIARELVIARLERARVRALLDAVGNRGSALRLDVPPGTAAAEVRLQSARLAAQYAAFEATLAGSRARSREREAERAAADAGLSRLAATIPLVSEEARAVKILVDDHLAPRTRWLGLERERIEQVKEREVLERRREMIEAAIAALADEHSGLEANFTAGLLAELTEIGTRESVYERELEKAERRRTRHFLRAPVAGVVQQLEVHTEGGVVNPAQTLMTIVPRNPTLIAEAWVANKDIGFVEEQQEAEVKLEAFPFTRFGTIGGRIVNLAKDAITHERLGPVYAARVALDRSVIDAGSGTMPLSPGMALTVEVKTGTRRVIEFLLSPLLRYRDETARER